MCDDNYFNIKWLDTAVAKNKTVQFFSPQCRLRCRILETEVRQFAINLNFQIPEVVQQHT